MTTITAIRAKYSALRSEGKFHGTIKRAVALRQERDARRVNEQPVLLAARLRRARRSVPLGIMADRFRELARAEHPRRSNWDGVLATTEQVRTAGWWIHQIDNGRYSSRCTWTHWTYEVRVTSYAMVVPSILYFHFAADPVRKIRAPHGYRWITDSNGVALVSRSTGADYHPTAADLVDMTPREIAQRLRENHATRKAVAKKCRDERAAVKRAEREGLMIGVHDSIAAGNCRGGTESWARRHNLDPRRHYRPSELLAIANGDTHRVALVVTVALRRHRREMAEGVCEVH